MGSPPLQRAEGLDDNKSVLRKVIAMRRGAVTLVVGWLACGLMAPASAQQPVTDGSLAAAQLVGTWRLDREKTKDGQDVWKRRLDAMRAQQEAEMPDFFGSASQRTSHGPLSTDWTLKSAMRDLLETAQRLSFRVSGDSITITDDLDRALTFATTGSKERHQLAATEFNARTRFSGGALTQQLTVDQLALMEVYLTSADGKEMLVSISVTKPDFDPPLKPIMRVYTRIDE